MYAVNFYAAAPGRFGDVRAVYPRHRAYVDEFAKSGEIVMIGTFGDPEKDGSMAIFRTRDGAERFIDQDPFVVEGLVDQVTILDWDPREFSPSGAA